MDKKVEYVCEECGSSDLLYEAWARWNIESQSMELAFALGVELCRKCDTEKPDVIEREVNDG